MKVLQVVGSLTYGGAETMVMNYYRNIDNKDCQMDILVHAKGNDEYEAEIKRNGGKVIYTETPGKVGVFKYIHNLTKILKSNGPYDVVHAHTNLQAGLVMCAAYRAKVIKRISHSHNTQFNAGRIRVLINRALVLLFGNLFLACGVEAGYAMYGKHKFHILNNAIDVRKFLNVTEDVIDEEKARYHLSDKAVIIGHVGRFVKQKNHEFLIKAFAQARANNDRLILMLVGDGPLLEVSKQLCQTLRIKDSVIFVGSRPDTERLYKTFDLFVLPSLHEGLPLTMIEAQCAGKNVLASEKITKEADLGIGLVDYLPLETDIWAQKLQGTEKQKQIDGDIRDMILKSSRDYDIVTQANRLVSYYKDKNELFGN